MAKGQSNLDSDRECSNAPQNVFAALSGLNDKGENDTHKEMHPFYCEIVEGMITHLAAIDTVIGVASANWSAARMALVEQNIPRVALYEILYRSDIPVKCAINEAIEIAKEFASPEGPTFIYGVLDKVASQRSAHSASYE